MPKTIGIGFLGAGAVTQAIHLPTLARLPGDFTIAHVSDVSPDVAASVAGRVGAASSTSIDAVLADPRVDVVAVCSPHEFHAAHVVAACRAGKQAVLCEKPFATTEAEAREIAAVSAETGVPIVVGAMHTFDPGWRAATSSWGSFVAENHTIRSSVVLPPNPRFEDFATEVVGRPSTPGAAHLDREARADLMRGAIMGLAIHDLPLIRTLLPRFDDLVVHSAHVLTPVGYQVVLTAGGRRVTLHALMSATWSPDWVLDAYSDTQALHLAFAPSYVHAGSAVASITTSSCSQTWGPAVANGYEGEWRAIAAIVRGTHAPPEVDELIDDLRFALAVADAASDLIRGGRSEERCA